MRIQATIGLNKRRYTYTDKNNVFVCNKIISAFCDIAPRKHRIQSEQVGYTSPWDNQLTPICV